MSHKNSDHYFLRGEGEMGELIRAKDWSQTSLGSPEDWPLSLRILVPIMLENTLGMYIAWGDDYIQLYNDSYRAVLGTTKHPQALGISAIKTFPEIWNMTTGPMFDEVMTGKAVGFPDFMVSINRYGYLEDCYFDFSCVPIIKEDGQVGGILATVIETTNKKKIEVALKESERRFRDTVQQAPVGMSIMRGKDYVVEMANDAYMQLIDREVKEFVGKPLFESLPEVKESAKALLDGVLNTGIPFHGNEVPIPLNRYGKQEIRHFDFLYYPLKEENGENSGVIVTATEVTEKITARNQIEQSKERYYNLIHSSPIAIAIIEGEGIIEDIIITTANKTIIEIWGKGNDVIGKKYFDVLPELAEQGFKEIIAEIYRTGIPFSANESPVYLLLDGEKTLKYFNFTFYPQRTVNNEVNGVGIIASEVTSEALLNNKIRENEKRFQLLVNDATVAIVVLTGAEMKVEIVNEAYGRLINLTSHELIGKPLFSLVPEVEEYYLPMLEKVRQSGEMLQLYDSPYAVTVNGKYIEGFLHCVFQPYRDTDGSITGVMAILQDVTEAVLVHKKIKQSEQRFQAAIEAVQGILWTNNGQGEMEGEQTGWASLTGQTYEEYQGYGWAKAVHPDDAQPSIEAWNEAVHERKPFIFEHRVKTKNEEWRHFSIRAIPLIDTDGSLLQWVGVHTDITEQKEAAQKIKESEERFKTLADDSPIFIFIIDPDPKAPVSYNNKTWLTYTGLNAEEAAGKAWNGIMHPEDIPVALECYVTALTARQPYFIPSVRLLRFDGEYRWHSFKGTPRYLPNGEFNGYVGVGWDIHDQKLVEEKIKESEGRFKSISDESPMIIFIVDPDPLAPVSYWNKTWLNYTGQTETEAAGRAWDDIVHPDDVQVFMDIYTPAFIARQAYFVPAIRIMRVDGQYRWHSFKSNPRYLPNGEFNGYIGVGWDIHDQKIAEEKIKESEQKFRLLADFMPQHIWTSTPEGNLNYFNQSVFDYSGLTMEQINKDGWIQIVHPDDQQQNIEEWINAVTTGKDFLLEHRFRKYDGEYRWQLSRAIPQRDEHGKIQMWVGTSTDIQDQKTFASELERQVDERTKELALSNYELQKMNKELESFAYISSHDLQEPLRKIQTFASHISDKESNNLSEMGKDYFGRMQKAAQRMQTLIQDLLAYSRTTSAERKLETMELSKIIAEVKDDLKEELKEKNATIKTNELCRLNIIPFQFRQLMHNLISNSLKFSNPEIPPLIKVECKIADGLRLGHVKLSAHRKYCHIRVSDNGIGFKQEYSEKIFDIFQRLHGRDEYQGTGIGLSIVKKIVENHEGIITAKGESNQGATFDIYIPAM